MVPPGDGRVVEFGIARMRVLAAGEPTGGAFSLVEASGDRGPWTVPHVRRGLEESFCGLGGEAGSAARPSSSAGRPARSCACA
ncbi:MAG: hypothetical protein KY449_02910, partial [Proteobacteria bacterium]|nr:hypothetical protein [Pseudomonadota bacterium]